MIQVKKIGLSDPNYKLQPFERETHYNCDETSDAGSVLTYNKTLIKKLDRLYESGEYNMQLVRAENVGGFENREYRIPRSWLLRIGPPRKLNLTPEQKKERAERMKKSRSAV